MNLKIDIITPLIKLRETALRFNDSPFQEGYVLAITHALELAKMQQWRIDMALQVPAEDE